VKVAQHVQAHDHASCSSGETRLSAGGLPTAIGVGSRR
jgi:hypothetical protein